MKGLEDGTKTADALNVRLSLLEHEAAQVCEWPQGTSDLVEPEPERLRRAMP